MRRVPLPLLVVLAAGAAIPATAHGGVIGGMGLRPEPDGNFDITLFDPLDPAHTIALPPGVVTTDTETRPVLASDGRQLVFRRQGPGALDDQNLIYVDRTTNAVTTLSLPGVPFGQAPEFGLSPDGRNLITKVTSAAPVGSPPLPTATAATILDSTALPAGPFPQLAAPVVDLPDEGGQPAFVTVSGRGRPDINNARRYTWVSLADAAGDFVTASSQELITGIVGGQSRATKVTGHQIQNPVLTPSDQSTITYDDTSKLRQVRMTATPTFTMLSLPNVTFGTTRQTEPQWTASGRYLAWIDKPFNPSFIAVPTKVFVYDTQTQGLVRPDGLLLGNFKFATGLTIAETPSVVSTFTLSTSVATRIQNITLNTNLLAGTSVGILVQRVEGKTKLLRRTVPRLVTVGRVPLGQHKKGANKIGWNGKVAGRRLKPGTYKITMRAVASDGKPSDLSKPVTLRVR